MADRSDVQSRAAAYLDRTHAEQRQALFEQHRMQEQRELTRRKGELQSFSRQHDEQGRRFDARTRRIEAGRERAREAIHQRHTSLAGRLQGMTKAGAERQRDEIERLADRAESLHGKARNHFMAGQERTWLAEQKARMGHARELMTLHQQHHQYRDQQTQHYQQNRDHQVKERTQALHQVAEQQWREQVRPQQAQQQGRGPS